MFNFTTQSVYNSIVTSGKDRNLWVVTGKRPALRIGNTRFDAENILDIQTKNPTVENLASVTFDMSKILIDQSSEEKEIGARIVLYISLSMNSQDSFYSNDFVYKGKPFYIEFKVKKGESAATIAQRVVAIAKKYFLFVTEEKILDITANSGNVTITGVNGYQQIKVAKLQKFDPNAKSFDCCNNIGEFVDVIVGVPVVYTTDDDGAVSIGDTPKAFDGVDDQGNTLTRVLTNDEVAINPGIEAFGDYNWIIHNLRLPTAANTNFWALTKNEMPVVGQVYTQFVIRLIANRDGIGGEVVGQRATSVTNHILYVAGKISDTSSAAYVVSEALKDLDVDDQDLKTDADDQLKEPYNVSANSNSGNNTGDNTGDNTGGNTGDNENTESGN